MSVVAIAGAGPIGAATAQRLAQRARVRAIRLIDADANAAAGRALDISQAGPVDGFDTKLTASDDVLAAAGADVIVVADEVNAGEWRGEVGLAMVERLVRAGLTAPFVFVGPSQTELMEASYRDLGVLGHRLVGTAPSALVSAVRALAGVELNLASVELTVVGRPPAFVVGWSAATTGGVLISDRIAGHKLLAISRSIPRFWPPGPYSIAAATAEVVEGLIFGSRHLHPALAIAGSEIGIRDTAVVLPLELGRLRVLSHVMPSLSPQEKTAFVNGVAT